MMNNRERINVIMKKILTMFHVAVTVVSCAMLMISFSVLLSRWNMLPEQIGVHFNPPTGEFDLYDDKIHAFYPYIVGFGGLLFLEIASFLAKKIKSGMKINADGERLFRAGVCILLDMVKICLSVFWVNWADCVIRQKAMNVKIPLAASEIVRVAFIVFLFLMVVIRVKYKKVQEVSND